MKVYKAFNQNGLLFNSDGKRLVLKDKFHFEIIGEDDAFEEIDTLNSLPSYVRNDKEMKEYINRHYQKAEVIKIFEVGQSFLFRVGLGKTRKKNENKEFFFICKLLEDLYSYKTKPNANPRLCKCINHVVDCLDGALERFETIYADSLNTVASNTIVHYFSLKRSSAMNVLKDFKPLTQIQLDNELDKLKKDYFKLPGIEVTLKNKFKNESELQFQTQISKTIQK